jgi:glycerol-3-phosphate dehydrogenase
MQRLLQSGVRGAPSIVRSFEISNRALASLSVFGRPTRAAQLARLGNDEFDLVVVGGGCTGAGVALDAATRGLKVALVERDGQRRSRDL